MFNPTGWGTSRLHIGGGGGQARGKRLLINGMIPEGPLACLLLGNGAGSQCPGFTWAVPLMHSGTTEASFHPWAFRLLTSKMGRECKQRAPKAPFRWNILCPYTWAHTQKIWGLQDKLTGYNYYLSHSVRRLHYLPSQVPSRNLDASRNKDPSRNTKKET